MNPHTIKTEIHNCTMFDLNQSSATAQGFGETERRLVICIDFKVAWVLRVGAVGEGDILVEFFCKFFHFEKENVLFWPRDVYICIVDI